MANTNFTPQSSNARSIKGFGENISQLSLCINVSHLNVSLFNMVSQKVVSPLKVSHSFMEDWVFGYRDGTGVVAHERTLSKITLKSLMVCTIHRIWKQQLHTQPLWWIEQLKIFSRRLANKRRYEKMACTKCSFGQSHNPQNQHRKSQQDQAKKK
jgi:hypothetical protein